LEEARSEDRTATIIKETGAYLCLDCGKCTGSCPIGKTGALYSPRLIVQHLMLEGRDPSETELWRCLTCGLCRERCPSDVDFPRFISLLRRRAREGGSEPEPTHGGTLQEIMRLMAYPGLRQERTSWVPDWTRVLGEDDRAEDVYFVGCAPYLDVVFERFGLDLVETHRAALELIRSTGIEPAVMADERCCGHDALWAGDLDLFRRLAERNLELFEKSGARRVFVSCPEGYHTFTREYPRFFGKRDLEFVNTVAYVAGSLEPDPDRNGEAVTYHDSCRMGRFLGLYDEPRQAIAATGSELAEMEFVRENTPCCGSNLWINCDALSRKMQQELLQEARRTAAGKLLTACDKCRIHLACAQMENGEVKGEIKTDNILRFLHRKGVMKS
jgi:Fe-S oxidoreductase